MISSSSSFLSPSSLPASNQNHCGHTRARASNVHEIWIMELLIHLITPLEAYGLRACGPFQCSPVLLTHPTQTICFQRTPNQMKSVLQPSTILFTRRKKLFKLNAQTVLVMLLVCCADTGNTACFRKGLTHHQ